MSTATAITEAPNGGGCARFDVEEVREKMYGSDSDPVLERFQRFRADRDSGLREQLIEGHSWIAQRCARRFAGRGEPFDDLLQVALLGLVKAVDRFDPEKGTSFPGYAMPTVMGELRRHFRDHTWSMSVPRRSKDFISGMNAAIEELNQRLGRSPSVNDVAHRLGVDPEVVLETMEATTVYRARPLSPTGSVSDAVIGMATLGSDDNRLQSVPLRESVLAAVRGLDVRSRCIVMLRFYEGCSQSEIGDRLGISQVHVSRLLNAALAQIRGAYGPL